MSLPSDKYEPFLLQNSRRKPGLVHYVAHRGLIKAPEKPDNAMGVFRAALLSAM